MIEQIIEFVREHSLEIWGIWGAIITIASLVVKLTPTPKDDTVWNVILKILNALALNPNEKKQNEGPKAAELEALENELSARDNDRTRANLTDALR